MTPVPPVIAGEETRCHFGDVCVDLLKAVWLVHIRLDVVTIAEYCHEQARVVMRLEGELIVASELSQDGLHAGVVLLEQLAALEHPVEQGGFKEIYHEELGYFPENLLHGVASGDIDGNARV